MTSTIGLAALRISKNAALNRVLSNDLVKDLTLITLEPPLDGSLCELKAADHLQGSPGGIALPPRHEDTTLITYKSPKQSFLGYLFSLDTNVIKCYRLEEGWRTLQTPHPHVWVWLFMHLT